MTQRKNYFVQKGVQSKFTLTILLLVFLIAVISFCNLYVIGNYVLENTSSVEHAQSMSEFIHEAMQVVWPRLLLIILVNLIIVVIIGVFYSHQFAGPSYKLEKSIKQIAQGDLSFKIFLRKNDSMHNVADSLNQMTENFRSVIRKANELTHQIKDAVDDLGSVDEASKSAGLLRGIAGELEDLLAGFRTGDEPAASTPVEKRLEESREASETE